MLSTGRALLTRIRFGTMPSLEGEPNFTKVPFQTYHFQLTLLSLLHSTLYWESSKELGPSLCLSSPIGSQCVAGSASVSNTLIKKITVIRRRCHQARSVAGEHFLWVTSSMETSLPYGGQQLSSELQACPPSYRQRKKRHKLQSPHHIIISGWWSVYGLSRALWCHLEPKWPELISQA